MGLIRSIRFAVSVAVIPVMSACSTTGDLPRSTSPAGETPAGQTSAGLAPGLYLLEVETGTATQLPGVPAGANASEAAVSPDRTRIAFASDLEGSLQIWTVNLDGSDLRRVTDDLEAVSPTWSPDGTQLAFVGFGDGTSRQLLVTDLEGDEVEVVTDEAEDVFGADWSPDGASILYQVRRDDGSFDLRSVDIGTGRSVTLCCGGASIAADADWAPDMRLIAFDHQPTPDVNFALYTIAPDGTDMAPLGPPDPSRYHGHPVFSPDGTRVAYQGGPGVWVLDLTSGQEREIHPLMWGPTWLDDDTLIAEIPPGL